MQKPNLLLGLGAALAVICIWSGFIVFSRAGVTTGLTAYDISALRFAVAGALVLPFAFAWWPRHLSIWSLIAIMICGPGATYSILVYLGLTNASAAYAGVFANGSLPIFTAILTFVLARDLPGRGQVAAIAFIILGGVFVGYRGMTSGGADVLSGIGLFLAASAVLSFYIYGVRYWALTPKQALVAVNIPNAALFLPIWYFFLPSGMAEAETSMILFQAAFQGLGPGFLALILFSVAAYHLGPTPTAGFSAVVPASAALLAIPVLSEVPTPMEWAGIAIVTLGLALLMVAARKSPE
ncbi:MAG: DMT family transporter [Pseudomonadota bacterium]